VRRPAARIAAGGVGTALVALCLVAAIGQPAGATTSPTCTQPPGDPEVTCTFTYVGGSQPFTVPVGVTSLKITADGAPGGSFYQGAPGGAGAEAQGTVTVTPGEALMVVVGGGGTSDGVASLGGGGGATGGASGGGASIVAIDNSPSPLTPLVVAGGGGGAGRGTDNATGGAGGSAGNAGNAGTTDGQNTPGGGGGGGTSSQGVSAVPTESTSR
jgi:hypothetical protein